MSASVDGGRVHNCSFVVALVLLALSLMSRGGVVIPWLCVQGFPAGWSPCFLSVPWMAASLAVGSAVLAVFVVLLPALHGGLCVDGGEVAPSGTAFCDCT